MTETQNKLEELSMKNQGLLYTNDNQEDSDEDDNNFLSKMIIEDTPDHKKIGEYLQNIKVEIDNFA